MAANASAELADIARRLAATDRTIKLRTAAAIRGVVKSGVITQLKASARERLPHAGGLNEYVASQPIGVRTGLSGRGSFVRVSTSRSRFSPKQTNSGYVRHPDFGEWHSGSKSEPIPKAAGWWTDVLKNAGPEVTAALMVVVREVAYEAALGR